VNVIVAIPTGTSLFFARSTFAEVWCWTIAEAEEPLTCRETSLKLTMSGMNKLTRILGISLITIALTSCVGSTGTDQLTIGTTDQTAGQEISSASCFKTEILPAIVETVKEQVQVKPATIGDDGTTIAPAVYQTQSRQAIIRSRKKVTFEAICEPQMTPDFIANLQRALKARGYYKNPITGLNDAATLRAVAKYQSTLDLAVSTLSKDAAQKLGLVVYTRQQILEKAY